MSIDIILSRAKPNNGRDIIVSAADHANVVPISRVDGRSAGARRLRDLAVSFADEIGVDLGASPATTQQLIRRLAQTSYELELLEASRARGEAIDPVAFVTLVNSQRRLLRDLRCLKVATDDAR